MSKIDFRKAFTAGLKGISRIILEFASTEQKGFTKDLRHQLSETAREEHPEKSISELAHMTGLQRNQIKAALTDDNPVRVMDKEEIILSDLWSYRDKDGLIPINGKQENSFHTIVLGHLKGRYPISTVKKSLVNSGAIREEGENMVILTNAFMPNKNEEITLNLTGVVINRFAGTIIHNKNTRLEDKINLWYQSSFKSTKVPPRNRAQMHKQLYALFQRSTMPEAREIIEKLEVDVPNGFYPECGVSMFEFDEIDNKKGENDE